MKKKEMQVVIESQEKFIRELLNQCDKESIVSEELEMDALAKKKRYLDQVEWKNSYANEQRKLEGILHGMHPSKENDDVGHLKKKYKKMVKRVNILEQDLTKIMNEKRQLEQDILRLCQIVEFMISLQSNASLEKKEKKKIKECKESINEVKNRQLYIYTL